MPSQIKRIAQTYLRDPVEIAIKSKTTTATNIRQRYWYVSGMQKLDALTRILEAEPFEAMLVFMRTKQATEEIAQKLQARGFAASAINGDMVQAQRERTIQQLKDGKVDILVATDVAARGLDVERISHVLNYDIPHDTEGYVHRIGRTGRAGRSGEAILFVTPREKRLLQAIERATRQPIAEMQLPSVEAVNDKRMAKFKQRIGDTLAAGELAVFQQLIEQYQSEHDVPAIEIAAALARMVQGNAPLLLKTSERSERARPMRESERSERVPTHRDPTRAPARERTRERDAAAPRSERRPGPRSTFPAEERPDRDRRPHDGDHDTAAEALSRDRSDVPRSPQREQKRRDEPEPGFETFRIEVGHAHGVKPGNIVGAIANEAGLDSKHIGRIDIRDDHSFVDLPEGMPSDVFKLLKKVWVSGQQLRITRSGDARDAHQPDRASRDFMPHGKPTGFAPKPDKSGGFAPRPAKTSGFAPRAAKPAGFAPRSSKPAGFARPKRPKPGKRPR
jgi:ATP-dependent RNA helicase DeaD